MLDRESRKRLLEIVRQSIRAYLLNGRPGEPAKERGALAEKKGAFVTLKTAGQLRGCIGHIYSERPLYLTVAGMAVEAAFHDPRFEPLDEDELEAIEIEISVLSELEPVDDVKEIEPGRHGVYLQKDNRSALYLPQVATENDWGLDEFLEHLCLKAGLPKGSWKEARLSKFTAEVFGEGSE